MSEITSIQKCIELISKIEIKTYNDLLVIIPAESVEVFKKRCEVLGNYFKHTIDEVRNIFSLKLADYSYPIAENIIVKVFKKKCFDTININYKLMTGSVKLSELD